MAFFPPAAPGALTLGLPPERNLSSSLPQPYTNGMVRGGETQSSTHLQLAEPPEEGRARGTNSGIHQHSQSQGLYFEPKGTGFIQDLIPRPCHLWAQALPPTRSSPQPGDASQVEQEADELLAAARGMKPGVVMSTQKQHCPAFYIPSPCGERAVNIVPIKSPYLRHL